MLGASAVVRERAGCSRRRDGREAGAVLSGCGGHVGKVLV